MTAMRLNKNDFELKVIGYFSLLPFRFPIVFSVVYCNLNAKYCLFYVIANNKAPHARKLNYSY